MGLRDLFKGVVLFSVCLFVFVLFLSFSVEAHCTTSSGHDGSHFADPRFSVRIGGTTGGSVMGVNIVSSSGTTTLLDFDIGTQAEPKSSVCFNDGPVQVRLSVEVCEGKKLVTKSDSWRTTTITIDRDNIENHCHCDNNFWIEDSNDGTGIGCCGVGGSGLVGYSSIRGTFYTASADDNKFGYCNGNTWEYQHTTSSAGCRAVYNYFRGEESYVALNNWFASGEVGSRCCGEKYDDIGRITNGRVCTVTKDGDFAWLNIANYGEARTIVYSPDHWENNPTGLGLPAQ